MDYAIVQPPFALTRETPKKQLRAYRDWFHTVMPSRLVALTMAVRSTAGFEHWEPDLSPDSLGALGEWFRGQVETRKRTAEDVERLQAKLAFPVDIVSRETLTEQTFSLAVDIGMYFGQTIVKNRPGTRWDQPLKGSRRDVDYGHPVIMGLGKVPLNPVRIVLTLAYGFADKSRAGDQLRAAFDIWSAKRHVQSDA